MTRMKWHTVLTAVLLSVGMTAPALADGVTGFTLVNADTDTDIRSLGDGDTIDLSQDGYSLNIRADVEGSVASVQFDLDGTTNCRTENVPPFALAGDSSGDYNAWTPSVGSHTLTATPDTGTALQITFDVVDNSDSGGDDTPEPDGDGSVTVGGEKKRWHKVTLTLDGPWASETGATNPFLDYRMEVTFTNGSATLTVPGYFAADGNAANTSATSGTTWRAHLCPDKTGTWHYSIAFKQGDNCAVNGGGSSLAPYDGTTGSFSVTETDKTGRDMRAKGWLEYVGGHYLRFKGSGEYFLKQGADAPENFLAYADFDGPFKSDGIKDNLIKTWSAHVDDWHTGDPTWKSGKGKGMIGAINYLASEGMNAFSFIPMNIAGDDRNVFPYLNYNERYRMDVSRLAQWAIVFEHGTRTGMFLHFKTQETENELLLDSGNLGTQRKLYYRELIARFAHNPALNWNLGEETNNASTSQKKSWAQYFWDNDPYHHHIVIHNGSDHYDLLGTGSQLTGFSLQTGSSDFSQVHSRVKNYLSRSDGAGKPWAVACDEPGDASHALRPDYDAGSSHEDGRKNGIWGTFMAGGWGNEWYFGYQHDHSDLTCQDFRSRDNWWDYCRYALQFFNNNDIPVTEMVNDNAKSSNSNDYCFFKAGAVYVVYLKGGGTTNLDLSGVSGDFTVKWYDPRNGGGLQDGTVTSVSGGGSRSLGYAPDNTGNDWTILVRTGGSTPPPPNQPPNAVIAADPTSGDAPLGVQFDGSGSSDPDGSIVSYAWDFGDGGSGSGTNPAHTYQNSGTYTATLTVTDDDGATDSAAISINVTEPTQPPPPPDQGPFQGENGVIPGKIEAEDYDLGGEGVAYHDTSTGNSGAQYRNDDVDIEACTDTGTGYNVGWTAGGEWLEYTVDVTEGTYDIELRVASNNSSPGSIDASIDGAALGSVDVAYTGGWQTWQTLTIEGVAIAGGQDRVLRLDIAGGNLNINWINFVESSGTEPPPPPPADLEVTAFVLVDAATDQDIAPLVDGDTINLADVGTELSVRATATTDTESVVFTLDGTAIQTESNLPYAIAGDSSGDYNPWTPTVGTHTLKATPYSLDGAGGDAGTALTVTFSVIDQANQAPTAAIAADPTGGYAPLDVQFDGSGSGDADGSVVSYAWDFGDGGSSSIVTPSHTYQSAGTYGVTLTVADDDGATDVATTTITVSESPQPEDVVFAVNCGGAEYTASDGVVYAADTQYTGGKTYGSAIAVEGTVDDTLYQSERYGNFSYAVPVPAGSYQVTLKFAEIYWDNAGKRIFDVSIEGTEVITDLDIVAAVGTPVALDKTFTAEVADGELNIVFSTDVNNAKCSAILVEEGTAPQPPDLAVTGFTLVDAATDQDIGPIADGDTINLAQVGTALNIRAAVSGEVESVRFALDGDSNFQTENYSPYALAGDNNGDYNVWTPATGSHTLTATPYTADKAGGDAGHAASVSFTVVDIDPQVSVVEDAYVENGTGHNDGTLRVENSGTRTRRSFIKLNVTGSGGQAVGATLTLTVSGDAGGGTLTLAAGSHSNWTESTISGSNAPAAGTVLDTAQGDFAVGNTVTFDLGGLIAGDGDYTVVLSQDATDTANDVWFGSSESSAAPVVQVQ